MDDEMEEEEKADLFYAVQKSKNETFEVKLSVYTRKTERTHIIEKYSHARVKYYIIT